MEIGGRGRSEAGGKAKTFSFGLKDMLPMITISKYKDKTYDLPESAKIQSLNLVRSLRKRNFNSVSDTT